MRITGGEWRSRRLKGPRRGWPLRPTPDAMRERVFAVLAGAVEGAVLLDLYAGTGAITLEALSRGAARAVAVEKHPAAARLLRDNVAALGATDRVDVLARDAAAAVRLLARRGDRFDLVWADPPFEAWSEGLAAVEAVADAGLLATHAIVCLECPADADVAPRTRLHVERDLRGGASRVVLLTRRSRNQGPGSAG